MGRDLTSEFLEGRIDSVDYQYLDIDVPKSRFIKKTSLVMMALGIGVSLLEYKLNPNGTPSNLPSVFLGSGMICYAFGKINEVCDNMRYKNYLKRRTLQARDL